MIDVDELAHALERVCLFALTRGMTCQQRRSIEADLERARVALSGGLSDVGRLRQWCIERGHVVLPDDLVRTRTAAAILDLSEGRLRNMRAEAIFDVPFIRRGHRVFYSLHDLSRLVTRRFDVSLYD